MNCNLKENAKQDQKINPFLHLEFTLFFFFTQHAFSYNSIPLKGNSLNNLSTFIVDYFQVNLFMDYQG